MKKNYIVGHKNPDTDTIVSAIVYAEIKKKLHEGEEFIAARPGKINKETKYVLERFGQSVPELLPADEKDVILVDHNEPAQMDDNIKPGEVVAIFDHHRLGGPMTDKPIVAVFDTTGATATILAKLAFQNNIDLTQVEASLLIAAIISDTFNLTSPTTTQSDKEVIEELNKTAKIDIGNLADEMFKKKSDISDVTTETLVRSDMKTFKMNGKCVGIGLWETVLPETVLARKDEIVKELGNVKRDENLDAVLFFVVDIINKNTKAIVFSDDERKCTEGAFGCKAVDGLVELPGIASRKKQIVPPLEKYFATV